MYVVGCFMMGCLEFRGMAQGLRYPCLRACAGDTDASLPPLLLVVDRWLEAGLGRRCMFAQHWDSPGVGAVEHSTEAAKCGLSSGTPPCEEGVGGSAKQDGMLEDIDST